MSIPSDDTEGDCTFTLEKGVDAARYVRNTVQSGRAIACLLGVRFERNVTTADWLTSEAQHRRPPGRAGGDSLHAALAPSGIAGRLFFCPKVGNG